MNNLKNNRYIKALNDAIITYISDSESIIAEIKNIQTKYRTEEQEIAVTNLREKLKEVQKTALSSIENAYTKYLERLDSAAVIDGAEIDANDISLLQNDLFPLSQSDFLRLASKHEGNYTMMTALKSYADMKHIDYVFYDKNAKIKAAADVRNSAEAYILNDTGYGVSDYCKAVAGNLFANYNYLND